MSETPPTDDLPVWTRYRFHADAEDFRPIKWPAPGPFWCSGSGEDYSIVIAYMPPGYPLKEWWPEATQIEREGPQRITYTDRFPKPEWWPDERV